MPCLGNFKEPIVKHARGADPDAILVFNRTEAHNSHAMASAPALRIHFCVACGCYAGTRSKGLKSPCARFPTKAGKEALSAIAVGKQPNAAAFALYRRLGKAAWGCRYSKGGDLAKRKSSGHKAQGGQASGDRCLAPAAGEKASCHEAPRVPASGDRCLAQGTSLIHAPVSPMQGRCQLIV